MRAATLFGRGFSNMLVATRDPSLHPGAAPPAGLGFIRLMNFLQVAGSLLAIPVGLASGYSIYHANFSVEARCQGLRGNIVSMLDRSADASTLRTLVRRDVKTFEQSCGAVDPDAVAAFKTLLAAGKPATSAAVAQSSAPAPAKQVKPAAAAKPVQRTAAGSDAKWLAGVRAALVSHHAEPPPVGRSEAARQAPPVALAPPLHAVVTPVAAPVASASATEAGHPVPPALIPEMVSPPPLQARSGYRLGALIAHVPLISGVFGR